MLIALFIVLAVIGADQLTKALVLRFLPAEGDSAVLLPGVFRFTHVDNTGVAFGLLKDARWAYMIVSVIALILVFVYLWVAGRKNRLETVSISLILGGGIGNMIDRIFRGYVVDFLDFCAFPKIWNYVFNVADACVCVGVALLVLALILGEVRNAKEKKKALSDGEKTPEEETHDPE